MTAITDANTFIDQNLINVPYQGVPATTLNACLKTITNVFNSYATIASVNSLFGYALDGNFPAALMNAPNQAFTLNGGYVSISALLLFSSGQKYTVGPDGNYILNAANGPAWDWSTGRCRLLVEAIGSTNYWTDSDAMPVGNIWNGSVAFAPNALLGALTLTTLTKTTSDLLTYVASGSLSVGAGGKSTFTIAVVAGNLTTCSVGILGTSSTWGTNGNATASVISGPGALSQNVGSLFNVTGLSSIPTIISITKTSPSAETHAGYIYQQSTNSGTAGDTLKYGRGQLELGSVWSSYIPCGASPTARAADVVTAASGLLALLQAGGALVYRGRCHSVSPSGTTYPAIGSTNRAASVEVSNAAAYAVSAANDVLYAAPSASPFTDFGFAVTWTAGQRKLAVNGGAVTSDNAALFSASDVGLQLFKGADGYANGELDELIVWPIYASDAGLQAQARAYS